MIDCFSRLPSDLRVAYVLGARIELRFSKKMGGVRQEQVGVWLSARDWGAVSDCEFRVHPEDQELLVAARCAINKTKLCFYFKSPRHTEDEDRPCRYSVPAHVIGTDTPVLAPYGMGTFVVIDRDLNATELAYAALRGPLGDKTKNDIEFDRLAKTAYVLAEKADEDA